MEDSVINNINSGQYKLASNEIENDLLKEYKEMIREKETIIEKLKSDLSRLKLNDKIANSIIESKVNYNNINDVSAKRNMHSSMGNTTKLKQLAPITNNVENIKVEKQIKKNNKGKIGRAHV